MIISKRFLRWSLYLLLFTWLACSTMAQEESYNFVYIASVAGTADSLSSSNPALQNVLTEHFTLPDGFSPIFSPGYGAFLDPTGIWVATFVSQITGALSLPPRVHLWNLQTGETRFLSSENWAYINPDFTNLAWSGDGQHVAFSIGETTREGESDTELYAYDLPRDILTRVTDDAFEQSEVYWSADSKYLMTFTTPCLHNEDCAHQLDMYHIEGGKSSLDQSVKLDQLIGLGNYSCDVKTSIDSRYVTFVSICLEGWGGTTGWPSRLYIWDRMTNALAPLTSFGVDAFESKNIASIARYQHNWLDPQTLLVGVDYQITSTVDSNLPQQYLLLYHLPDLTPESLSENYGSNYILNPTTLELYLSPFVSPIFRWATTKTTPLEVASLASLMSTNKENLESSIVSREETFPLFCKSFISPDGMWLALSSPDTNGGCTNSITELKFVSLSKTQKEAYTISAKEGSFLIPLGWTSEIPGK